MGVSGPARAAVVHKWHLSQLSGRNNATERASTYATLTLVLRAPPSRTERRSGRPDSLPGGLYDSERQGARQRQRPAD